MPIKKPLMSSLPTNKARSIRPALFPLAAAGVLVLVLVFGCGNDPGAGNVGEGDDLFSTRVDLTEPGGAGAIGGAGGAGGIGGAGGGGAASDKGVIGICTPDVVLEDELPECFVAEVASADVSCDAAGREPLRDAWEEAAREQECLHRGLTGSECEALSLCGIVKLEGADRDSCAFGLDSGDSGFCVRSATSECEASSVDSLNIVGVREEAEALHVYCAVD